MTPAPKYITSRLDSPSTNQLAGKVCILTGVGLKGIGHAAAFLYAHEGASSLYLLNSTEEDLSSVKEAIISKYPNVKVTLASGDATEETIIKPLIDQAIAETGRLDVFFANAGVTPEKPLQDILVNDFRKTMRQNVLSGFLAIQHGSTAMGKTGNDKEEGGGSVILTASIAGMRSGAGSVDYSCSKAAVINLAQTCSHQLAHTNVRINSISPGFLETGLTTDGQSKNAVATNVGKLNPLGRFALPEEVAAVSLFLASDASSYINGQNIVVDGGLSASHPVI